MRPSWILGPLLAGIFLGGCSSGPASTTARKPAPRGKPAHIRFVNLTTDTVSAKVGTTYNIAELEPGQMSGALSVSPGKTHKVIVLVNKKEMTLDQPTEPGKFATVLIKADGLSGFISGKSLSNAEGPILDYVNLTDKPLTFTHDGQSVAVNAKTSESVDASNGSVTVSVGPSNSVTASLGKAQIWAVYAYQDHGKVMLKVTSVKGSGGVAGMGGSAL